MTNPSPDSNQSEPQPNSDSDAHDLAARAFTRAYKHARGAESSHYHHEGIPHACSKAVVDRAELKVLLDYCDVMMQDMFKLAVIESALDAVQSTIRINDDGSRYVNPTVLGQVVSTYRKALYL